MSDKPFISVMILSYNYGEMLKKALDACKRQTFSDFEIIMINNGSTDNTEEVFKKFQEENPGISTTYILINPNKGPINAWNEALKHVNGTYVMFHDADDWMEPDCLEKLAKKAIETGADRVTGAYQEVVPDGSVLRKRGFAKNPARVPIAMLQGTIFRYLIIAEHKLVISEKIGNAYDIWFTVRFATYESSSSVVKEIIYNYYFNPNSVISKEKGSDTALSAAYALYDGGRKTSDAELREEVEYIGIRHCFASVMAWYVNHSVEDAKIHYKRMIGNFKKYFPDYQKNKLIWPFHNGYEFSGSLACAILCLLDRLHMMWLIVLPAKAFKGSKMLRAK